MSKKSEWIIEIRDGIPHLTDRKDETDYCRLIRCKDCKHWHEDVANFTSIPRGACKLVRGITNGDFFCALGERREEK